MIDIEAVALDLQTDDLNPQTTPDIRPNKPATAGKDQLFPFLFVCLFRHFEAIINVENEVEKSILDDLKHHFSV